MKIPVSILFSMEDEATRKIRESVLSATSVPGVSAKTHWTDMTQAQKEALVEAYYGVKKQALPVADLDAIALEKPKEAVEEEP
jgi:hypothetical protein